MHTTVYIACSLDGYIAKTDGSLDWLPPIPSDGSDDYGYAEFMNGIDAIVMGRNTYEAVLEFGEWPYRKPVFVLSTSLKDVPEALRGSVTVMSGKPARIIGTLSGMGMRNLYIDGGKTIQSFLEYDLIDEIILTTVSVLLGDGIPLFGKMTNELEFQITETRRLNGFLVQTRFVRRRNH